MFAFQIDFYNVLLLEANLIDFGLLFDHVLED